MNVYFIFSLCFYTCNSLFWQDNTGIRYVKKGEYPFAVCLFNFKTHTCYCTAAIVTKMTIITSGHCFKYYSTSLKTVKTVPLSRIMALIGVVNAEDYTRQQISILNVKYQSGFEIRKFKNNINDIALAELKENIIFDVASPMKTAGATSHKFKSNWDKLVAKNILCDEIGFGLNGNTTKYLQSMKVKPLTETECLKYQMGGENLADNGMICTSVLRNSGFCSKYWGSLLYCDGRVWASLSTSMECSSGISFYYLYTNSIKEFNLQANPSVKNIPSLYYILWILLSLPGYRKVF